MVAGTLREVEPVFFAVTDEGWVLIVGQLLTFVTAFVTTVLAYLASARARRLENEIKQIHINLNSRLTELLRASVAEALQKGHLEGREEGREEGRQEGREVMGGHP